MTAIRSATALRRLYERYRTATSLKTSAKRPGQWLAISAGTADGSDFTAAFGVDPGAANAIDILGAYANTALNGVLGIRHELDVRVVAFRTNRSVLLHIRFTLVRHGKKVRGSKLIDHGTLPASSVQLDLDSESNGAWSAQKVGRQDSLDQKVGRQESGTTSVPDGDEVVPLTLPDGSPLPDLSDLLTPEELVADWAAGKLPDVDAVRAGFEAYSYLFKEMDVAAEIVEDELVEAMFANITRTTATLGGTAPPLPAPDEKGDSWDAVSTNVYSWVMDRVRSMRHPVPLTGRLLVLAPSPGTGKSHAMIAAAVEEQNARRRVGYAVLSRAQFEETSERLKKADPRVHLIVIEGRNETNCSYFDQVTIATNAGFSPGATVCPDCERYPLHKGHNANVCPYYKQRIDAHQDRVHARRGMRMPAIILTTHASAVQGSHLLKKRYGSFWEFDSLFIDEDPTESMVQMREITHDALTYVGHTAAGNLDGAAYGTAVLRDAIVEALKQRSEADERGYMHGDRPDHIHSRDHGSSYAGVDLHTLLESVARRYQLTLKGLAATVIDGMDRGPVKGEIMNLSADDVARRFPNRHLAALFAALDMEITAIAEARAAGVDLEPAYRVHLDLVKDETGESGEMHATFRVHELRGYANGRTNVVIGDAYANAEHYEGLFDRYRHHGVVEVLKARATWPTSSTLVRIVTHAGRRDVSNSTQHIAHLNEKLRPILHLERGRKIVFYTHKKLKSELRAWLDAQRETLNVASCWLEDDLSNLKDANCAIEHWGSGRGKDVYKDFHTFIAVTEYVPNVGAMIHEANTIAALASVSNTRVAHWSPLEERRGSMSFVNSLSHANPFYQAAFHRKATDELAQAVHRIRPAMRAKDGQQKRAYVLGHLVPWTDELLAATSLTAVVDDDREEVSLETVALGKGARFNLEDSFGLMSAREVAGTIAEAFRQLGVWSHVFIHALMSVPTWAQIEASLAAPTPTIIALLSSRNEEDQRHELRTRIEYPISTWASVLRRIREGSRVYRQGYNMWRSQTKELMAGRFKPDWAPISSHGFDFVGSKDAFENIMKRYGPQDPVSI